MNAKLTLLAKVSRATVSVHTQVPAAHISNAIGLGTDRCGTGTIVSADGLILTVYYMVMGARRIVVTLADGEQQEARIIGQDYATGLALIKINGGAFPYLEVVSSTGVTLGQEAFIVASLGEDKRCADCGIITYLGSFDAVWEFFLERSICMTASALNIGLNGGPICSASGQVFGISYLNFAEIGRPILGIPGELFTGACDELVRHGRRISIAPRMWLGLLSYTLQEHVIIAGVMPGSPSEKAGLKQGDVVLMVDGRDITERRALYDAVNSHRPGEIVNLKILRNNQVQQIAVPAIQVEDYLR
ncbi:MAG: serine protease [Candidatus Binataceae bacterium]|nr:serine protease [Candidatus Binataceae bacterium]